MNKQSRLQEALRLAVPQGGRAIPDAAVLPVRYLRSVSTNVYYLPTE